MGLKDNLISKIENGEDIIESTPEAVIEEETNEAAELTPDVFFKSDEMEAELTIPDELPDVDFNLDPEPVEEIPTAYVPPAPEPEPIPTATYEPEVPEFKYQPEPEPAYEPTPTYTALQVDTSSLEGKLLQKAKATILQDVVANFESEMFTKQAIEKMIGAYKSQSDAGISNYNQVFASFIDEVLASKYNHDYYDDLTKEVLSAVKSDVS